ncbi:MAG: universal stress protein [Blastocatellales bacterium]
MRVLLAIDDSQHSWEAVESVAARPWPSGTIVRVMSSVEYMIPAGPEFWYDANGIFERTRKGMLKRAEQITSRAVNTLAGCGLWANKVVRDGNPRAAIIEEAIDWNADLIVVGSHAYTGIKRLILGSVAQYVVSHAPCSVEVIQQRRIEEDNEMEAAA